MASEVSDASRHVFMVSYPGQGHVNPLLRLGNFLAAKGLFITFSTTENFGKDIMKANNFTDQPIPVGDGSIRFEFFDDEWDYTGSNTQYPEAYNHHLEVVGRRKLHDMLKKHEEQGRSVCYAINNPFVPWVSDVAESLGIPSAVLWVQSCACFAAYYYYHQGLVAFPTEEEPEIAVQLPCMPLLKHDEVPSFLHPSTPYASFRRIILGQFENLTKPFCILMDTFYELENELIDHMSKICPIKTIGPLFRGISTISSAKIRGDILKADDDCIAWLDSKPPSSVVYISFGTIVSLSQEQVNEIAYALLNTKVPFLWVMKPPKEGLSVEPVVLPDGFLEEVGADKGKVVQWSPQDQVLAHPSIACFLTHCGWNSTMEALTNGVPLLAFPQWGDQVTNAKYLEEVYKVGIRLCRGHADKRIIPRDEIEKGLLEGTSGPKAAEMKENVLKWRKKAENAVADDGSSIINMHSFVDEIMRSKKN